MFEKWFPIFKRIHEMMIFDGSIRENSRFDRKSENSASVFEVADFKLSVNFNFVPLKRKEIKKT